MIALDTNVLVRFLVEDDHAQMQRARKRIEDSIASGTSFFVADIVLCELVWVLKRSYKVSRVEIYEKLLVLSQSQHLRFSSLEAVLAALHSFKEGSGDFADYLISETARRAGCDAVVTFDQALLSDPGFVEV